MKAPLRYRLLLVFLSPLVLLYILYSARKSGDGKRYILQRFGFTGPDMNQNAIWLHAASVGEVNAALPLLKALIERYPNQNFIITTNTTTGAVTAISKLPQSVQHCYLPLDYKASVRRFFNKHTPQCLLIIETELWPNLYAQCRQRNIPIIIINARLSEKTLRARQLFKPVFKFCLQQVSNILARSDADKNNFASLGANPEQIEVIGNIKFATHTEDATADIQIDRPYVLAASTHAGEESMLLSVWKSLHTGKHLLIIVPRYPERKKSILRAIRRNKLSYAVRSENGAITNDTDVYLADTLGELKAFIKNAEMVFMGGSLVPRGGQNVLEPAHFSKAIITGQYTFTFKDIVDELLKAQAIIQVPDVRVLKEQLAILLSDPIEVRRLGDNAKRFIDKQANVAEKYTTRIFDLMRKLQDRQHSNC